MTASCLAALRAARCSRLLTDILSPVWHAGTTADACAPGCLPRFGTRDCGELVPIEWGRMPHVWQNAPHSIRLRAAHRQSNRLPWLRRPTRPKPKLGASRCRAWPCAQRVSSRSSYSLDIRNVRDARHGVNRKKRHRSFSRERVKVDTGYRCVVEYVYVGNCAVSKRHGVKCAVCAA